MHWINIFLDRGSLLSIYISLLVPLENIPCTTEIQSKSKECDYSYVRLGGHGDWNLCSYYGDAEESRVLAQQIVMFSLYFLQTYLYVSFVCLEPMLRDGIASNNSL